MLVAILTIAAAQLPPVSGQPLDVFDPCLRTGGRCAVARNGRPSGSLAFFEFAPASGAGMGAACACASITGAKGETVTFTRTGNATCSRQGLATTGIQNGDLVSCGANLPRVEPSGGVLGLRTESARTNDVLRSQELDNAVWTDSVVGVAAPTITANAATAPDGTLTAERIQFPATTSGQTSVRIQTGLASGTRSPSIYIRGNGTSGSVQVQSYSANADVCIVCSFVPDSWTRCEGGSSTSQTGFGIGPRSFTTDACGTGNQPAADIFVWGAQSEVGTYATSYIPTTSAAVTRNADDATVGLPAFTLGNLSMAATAQKPSATPVMRVHGALTKAPDDGANFVATYQDTGVLFGQFVSTAGNSVWNTGLSTAAATVRTASFINGSNVGACVGGTCSTNPIGTFNPALITSPRRLRIGAYSTTNGNIDGVATLVCLEPNDPARCR